MARFLVKFTIQESLSMTTAIDVARWMQSELVAHEMLYQNEAAYEIANKFGDEFVYENDKGGLSISKAVRKEFRKLNEETVVWDAREKYWRLRTPQDAPGRSQTDY
jgi:hypothetical protein